jgi:hypothetical protein
LYITTDNERLKVLYKKYAVNEEKRVSEIQETLDRARRQRSAAINSSNEED